ncbi:CHAT domain-containing protein [Brasilonema octagenarum UFV-E1]|uniref:CHAT domain-containing protein n=1 Tax=Brasilonema sennae CENA114 TaxID=415709 RepID=A0A856MLL8_9CYAN|nr:CHAT domain-containing protein [Brasilonema sennae]QDL11269.1 CHAT domain-containing protein [Brasilonema sennae CENA114]QDL17614.1 CHAT domain-containing protein [Brasilonema octagenarum UFV-E1]
MAFKISFKIGGRVQLNHSEVLPVTLAIYDQEGQIEELVSFLSPLPKPLEDKFKEWQYYIGLQGNRKVAKNRDKLISGVVNLTELANSLKTELNKWLGRDGWIDENGQSDQRVSRVLEKFRKKITQKDEIQIIVQTEDRQLRGLPWQEWDTLAAYTSRGVEVAISATNFKRLTQKQTPQLKATARILVVFGDEKLGFAEEEDFIKSLRQHGGEPHILRQPTRQELEQKLKDSQGWQIFFFAGHSESDRDGRIGRIQINSADGAQGIIEITELTDLLQDAIQKKLQLAIFNSCDGLGLANQLTELSLPYCIVMREMVESSVARELLRHFLEAFVKDRSLFASMNAARQQLQKKFEPGKSWLPVIVANPLAKELTWNRLFSERRLSWRWEMVLGMIAIAVLVCLPIGIFSEFQGWETLTLYAGLYPHLVVYPSLFLWMPLFAAYRAHCMIRVKTRPFVFLTLLTIFLVSGGLFFELTGDRIMLMEFKSDATTTIYAQQLPQLYLKWQTSAADIQNIPQEIFNTRQIFDVDGNLTLKKSELEPVIKRLHTFDNIAGFQGLLRIATAYDVWRQNTQPFSISRWFYAFTFIAIISCGVQILALVATIWFVPDSIFNKNKYLTYVIICELGILLWVPFQSYSIEHTKSLLFSPELKGTLAGLNVLLYAIIAIIFSATVSSIYRSATKKYQPILLSFLLGSFILTLLGSWFGVYLIDHLFGMNSTNPLTPWFASSLFFAVLFFFLFVRLIDHGVGDE